MFAYAPRVCNALRCQETIKINEFYIPSPPVLFCQIAFKVHYREGVMYKTTLDQQRKLSRSKEQEENFS